MTELVNGKAPASFLNQFTIISADKDLKRYANLKTQRFPLAPQEWIGTPLEFFNVTDYFQDKFVVFSVNGAELLVGTAGSLAAADIFAWLPAAQACGQVEYEGRRLACWSLGLADSITFYLLVDNAGAPALFQRNVTMGENRTDFVYKFTEYHANESVPWIWENFTVDGFLHPKPCPRAKPINISMYVFHPKNNFDISGQDLADLVGEAVFVCSDIVTNQSMSTDHNYAWLTQWELEVDATWGQYANCNGYPPLCVSAEEFRVGHEAAYYLGRSPALSRQCGPNPLVGEWYSLPEAGKCNGTATPGDGSCSWRIVRRVKTIDGQCLFRQGSFRQSCIDERRAPFPKTTQLMQRAFQSSDPAHGGCPPIDLTEVLVV